LNKETAYKFKFDKLVVAIESKVLTYKGCPYRKAKIGDNDISAIISILK
jgi:hypothetical protein